MPLNFIYNIDRIVSYHVMKMHIQIQSVILEGQAKKILEENKTKSVKCLDVIERKRWHYSKNLYFFHLVVDIYND